MTPTTLVAVLAVSVVVAGIAIIRSVAARKARAALGAKVARPIDQECAGRDGPDDGDAGNHHADREDCHQGCWGHDSRSVALITKKCMPRPLFADVARSLGGPAYGEEHSPSGPCPPRR